MFSSKEESDLFMKNENENTWIRIHDQQCNIWVSRKLSSLDYFLVCISFLVLDSCVTLHSYTRNQQGTHWWRTWRHSDRFLITLGPHHLNFVACHGPSEFHGTSKEYMYLVVPTAQRPHVLNETLCLLLVEVEGLLHTHKKCGFYSAESIGVTYTLRAN